MLVHHKVTGLLEALKLAGFAADSGFVPRSRMKNDPGVVRGLA